MIPKHNKHILKDPDLHALAPGSRSCTQASWSHFPCSWWGRTSPPVCPLSSHQKSCCSRAGPPTALQHQPSPPPVSPRPVLLLVLAVARWLLPQVRQFGPLRAGGSALTCCCCRGRWRLFHGFPWFGRSSGSAEAAVSAAPVAREGAPSGHRAGRNSGSSACPGCAASACLRPQTHSTVQRCWKISACSVCVPVISKHFFICGGVGEWVQGALSTVCWGLTAPF